MVYNSSIKCNFILQQYNKSVDIKHQTPVHFDAPLASASADNSEKLFFVVFGWHTYFGLECLLYSRQFQRSVCVAAATAPPLHNMNAVEVQPNIAAYPVLGVAEALQKQYTILLM